MFARKILIHKRNKFALISLCVAASQALIPSTLLGFHSLTHWADQSYFLRSMQELEASQGATSPSAMGLGYAAVIQLFKQFFGSYEVALVGLSVLSFLIIYSILIQNAFYIEDKIRKVFSILVIALSYVLLRIPLIRDIPWSHFVFAALLFLSIVVFNSPSMRIDVKYFTIGYLGFLLWQIRNFESTAIVLGLIFCSVIYLLICPSDLKVKKLKNKVRPLFFILTGTLFSWSFIYFFTGSSKLFTQFSGAPKPDLNIPRLLIKFLAVFYNPTIRSVDQVHSIYWEPSLENFTSLDIGKVWSQPFLISQPIFIGLLIFSTIMLVYLTFYSIMKKTTSFQIPIFCFVVPLIITFGYFTQPIFNQSQLKYGALREFLLPQLLVIFGIILTLIQVGNDKTRFWKGQPLILLVFAIIPMSFFTMLVVPKPVAASFANYEVQLQDRLCVANEARCFFAAKVLTKDGWQDMTSQPMEIRVIEAGVNSRFYKNDFSFEPDICKTECFIYAVPLSFGIAETPASDDYFLEKKGEWILLKRK